MSNIKRKIKVIFIGTPEFALPTFSSLVKDDFFDIKAVITQPDKKIGRKQILAPPPIKTEANKYKIPVHQPQKIQDTRSMIQNIDLIIVMAYGQILPKKILDAPKYGCLNVHASLLPRYRGSACLSVPILAGDEFTGITVMLMDESLDTGPILTQNKIKINPEETTAGLHDKLSKLSAQILPKVIKDYIQGKIKPVPQDNAKATYVRELKKEDGKINWQKPAVEIERMVRALNPWPGVFGELGIRNYESGESIIKFLEVEHKILKINKYKVGELFLDNGKLAVQCGQGALVIKKLQLAGKKPMSADDFLRGHKEFIGQILK